jgi:acetyl/propionyl-CoA carboxylase alpha subunit
VHIQLLLSQGARLSEVIPASIRKAADPANPPTQFSCQLRITAENVHQDYSLSIGKISSFQFPSGNGIRVDTNLVNAYHAVVGSDFDSLLAKLIITAPTWPQVVQKARRALEDTNIVGVKTNLEILRGIVSHPDFSAKDCDTRWLETNHESLLEGGEAFSHAIPKSILPASSALDSFSSASSTLFRKGDAWTISLSNPADKSVNHHMQLTKVLRNEFPTQLSADILYTTPTSSTPTPYTLTLQSTSSSAAAATANHRKGNPADPRHVVIPFPGTLIEFMVDVGDHVREDDVICVVRQMKMELEVRAGRAGTVGWVTEIEDGEEVTEGVLAAELVFDEERGKVDAQAKL